MKRMIARTTLSAHIPPGVALPNPFLPVMPKPFGSCVSCGVCLEMDVNHGRCTVCGERLDRLSRIEFGAHG